MKKILITLLLALPLFGFAQKKAPKTFDLLIGNSAKDGNKAIFVYRLYAETGNLAYLSQIDVAGITPFLCISNDGKFVYALSETDKGATLNAFKFDKVNGKLVALNSQPTGNHPTHLIIDKAQKNILVSNYGSGSLMVLPVNKDGSLGAVTQTIQDEGSSIDKERQAGPHVRSAILSPDEKRLFYADQGTDKLNIYRYKASKIPPLTPEDPSFVSVTPGSGPGCIDFSADGKYLYLLQAMAAQVTVYSVDGAKLKPIQTVVMQAEPGFKDKLEAADMHIAPNGQYLYTSTLGKADVFNVYMISPVDGKLTLLEYPRTMGKLPRNFTIDAAGKFVVVANEESNSINVLSIDQKTGRLYPNRSRITDISKPVSLALVLVE
ncbi:MAG: lactonase family protein [Mucilaginibacter sp.]